MRFPTLLVLPLTAALTSCGGGGSDPTPCSSAAALGITAVWNSNGTVAQTLEGKVGVPLSAKPIITGVPDSCIADEHFSTTTPPSLPAGLSLNAQTGEITGTPTQQLSTGATGMVQLELPGFNAVPILNIANISAP